MRVAILRMPSPRTVLSLVGALVALVSAGGCGAAADQDAVTIISLGDSLAVGVQPRLIGADTETREGYPRQLARMWRERGQSVRLVELGCGGATSASVLSGGRPCAPERDTPYRNEDPASSQLAAAEGELSRLGAAPAVVIIDVGGNDVGSCLQAGVLRPGCIARAGRKLAENLDTLLGRLRAVAPDVPIAILDLYNPFLGLWNTQPAARPAIRAAHTQFLKDVNGVIAATARTHDVAVGKLGAAMQQPALPAATDESPAAVEAVCAHTWMCVAPPQVPDIHLRASGYALAARVLDRALQSPGAER